MNQRLHYLRISIYDYNKAFCPPTNRPWRALCCPKPKLQISEEVYYTWKQSPGFSMRHTKRVHHIWSGGHHTVGRFDVYLCDWRGDKSIRFVRWFSWTFFFHFGDFVEALLTAGNGLRIVQQARWWRSRILKRIHVLGAGIAIALNLGCRVARILANSTTFQQTLLRP